MSDEFTTDQNDSMNEPSYSASGDSGGVCSIYGMQQRIPAYSEPITIQVKRRQRKYYINLPCLSITLSVTPAEVLDMPTPLSNSGKALT